MLRGEVEDCVRRATRALGVVLACLAVQSKRGRRARQASPGIASVSVCDQVWGTTQAWLTRVEWRDRPWKVCDYVHRPAARRTADGRLGDRLLRGITQ